MSRRIRSRVLKKPASIVLARHCRLTISAAFTNVTRLIQRVVNLRGSTYGQGRRACLGRLGRAVKCIRFVLRNCRLTGHCQLTDSLASATSRHWALTSPLVHTCASSARREPHYSSRRGPRCGRTAERRVSARRGWAGETKGHFEHPAGSVNPAGGSRSFAACDPTQSGSPRDTWRRGSCYSRPRAALLR